MGDIERKAPAIPLSAQIRIAAEMSPLHNRGLAAMMLEEWVPEAQRLEGAVATRNAMTTKLAAILRLTYDERMPDDLADRIRSLCAHPGGQ